MRQPARPATRAALPLATLLAALLALTGCGGGSTADAPADAFAVDAPGATTDTSSKAVASALAAASAAMASASAAAAAPASTASAAASTTATPTAVAALPGPTITLTPANGSTYSKAALGGTGSVYVKAVFASNVGLPSASLAGGFSGGTGFFPPGTMQASEGLAFYAGYFPTGTYKFTATAVDINQVRTVATIDVIIVP